MVAPPTGSTRLLTGLSTVLLVAGIGYGGLLLVGVIVGRGPSGDEVAIHTKVATERVADLPADTLVPEDLEATVRVEDASAEQQRWAAARDLAPVALVLAAVWLLRGVLRSVRDRDPFTETNVKRLRALALVVLIGVPIADLIRSLCESELASSAGLESIGTDLTIPGNAMLGGLAIFVLAEVFATGVRLRDDLEGTV